MEFNHINETHSETHSNFSLLQQMLFVNSFVCELLQKTINKMRNPFFSLNRSITFNQIFKFIHRLSKIGGINSFSVQYKEKISSDDIYYSKIDIVYAVGYFIFLGCITGTASYSVGLDTSWVQSSNWLVIHCMQSFAMYITGLVTLFPLFDRIKYQKIKLLIVNLMDIEYEVIAI